MKPKANPKLFINKLAEPTLSLRHLLVKLIAPKLYIDMRALNLTISHTPRPMTLAASKLFGNTPLTAVEIGVATGRNSLSILKLLNIDILGFVDRSFLFSLIMFLGASVLDWGNSNLNFSSSISFSVLAFEFFVLGVFLLSVGIIQLERLRRIIANESDFDPAPFDVVIFLGIIFAMDIYILYSTLITISNLTDFGKALFVSSVLSIPGIIIAVLTWDKKGWRRTLGVIFLLAPFFVIVGALILSLFRLL